MLNIHLIIQWAFLEGALFINAREQLRQPTAKPPSLLSRFQETSGRLQNAKFRHNPQKQQKLERLLKQMEALLAEE
ncbi:hypothetical protein [Coleofasciculus sp.]|uniref:hypothetical protein n=1 Tax=Coleofasciculus sp. TaxID=3100458 RepID=UPI004064AEA6